MNYVPNPIARALGSNKIGTVAVVFQTLLITVQKMVRGALEELENMVSILCFLLPMKMPQEKNYLQQLKIKWLMAIFIAGYTRTRI